MKLAEVKIVENSLLARLARVTLKSNNVAMVVGKAIYLSGVKKEIFLKNKAWVAHEYCHIRQFEKYGFFRFLWLYLVESVKVGYYNNKFELEARQAETSIAKHEDFL